MSDRSFRIVSIKGRQVNHTGRYHGEPAAAARKAFRRMCRDRRTCKTSPCRFGFEIEETTRGGDRRVFSYVGSRKKLAKPIESTRGGETFMIEYEISVKAA